MTRDDAVPVLLSPDHFGALQDAIVELYAEAGRRRLRDELLSAVRLEATIGALGDIVEQATAVYRERSIPR